MRRYAPVRKLLLLFGLLTLAIRASNADPTTYIIREDAGAIIKQGNCNSWSFQQLRDRLFGRLQFKPLFIVDGLSVVMWLDDDEHPATSVEWVKAKPVVPNQPNHPLNAIANSHLTPVVVARWEASSATIEVSIDTTEALAPAHFAFTDRNSCTAKWMGLTLILPTKFTKKETP